MNTNEWTATLRNLRDFIKENTRKGGYLNAESRVYLVDDGKNQLYCQHVGEFVKDIRRMAKAKGNEELLFETPDGWHDRAIGVYIGLDDHADMSLFVEIEADLRVNQSRHQ